MATYKLNGVLLHALWIIQYGNETINGERRFTQQICPPAGTGGMIEISLTILEQKSLRNSLTENIQAHYEANRKPATIPPKPAPADIKLTVKNREMLEAAKSSRGTVGFIRGAGSNGGGSIRRMQERLIKLGLLNSEWPWRITEAGRTALKEKKK